jgi:hypothetical protein
MVLATETCSRRRRRLRLGIVWIALSVLLFATGAVDFDFDTNS